MSCRDRLLRALFAESAQNRPRVMIMTTVIAGAQASLRACVCWADRCFFVLFFGFAAQLERTTNRTASPHDRHDLPQRTAPRRFLCSKRRGGVTDWWSSWGVGHAALSGCLSVVAGFANCAIFGSINSVPFGQVFLRPFFPARWPHTFRSLFLVL